MAVFVLTEEELDKTKQNSEENKNNFTKKYKYPFPFQSAKEMLAMGEKSGLTIAKMKLANEEAVLGYGRYNEGIG